MKIYKYPEHSSCKSKKSYDTINDANDAGKLSMYNALELNNTLPIQLYIYQCEYCNKYHLTRFETEYKVF